MKSGEKTNKSESESESESERRANDRRINTDRRTEVRFGDSMGRRFGVERRVIQAD